jgi:homoserine dehydrogenase
VKTEQRITDDGPRTPIDIALLGFGNVGSSFAQYVAESENTDLEVRIRGVADSTGGVLLDSPEELPRLLAHKQAGRSVSNFSPRSISDPREFIASLQSSGVRALVESLPTNLADGQPALDLLSRALATGMNVVTADKGPLVHGFDVLKKAAEAGRSHIAFSGTTGVPIPDELISESVLEIRGVLNGTTNYILTEMQERGISFEKALARAQADGIAEPDPGLDVNGWDTACKILILAKSLMGAESRLAEVSRLGIGPETEWLIGEARARNCIVRLIGRARIWQGRVRVSVAPKLLPPDSPFFTVAGTSKAAVFRTQRGQIVSHARSGRDAIARTLLDDLARIV